MIQPNIYQNKIEAVKGLMTRQPRLRAFVNLDRLKFSIGNSKIGKDTLILNMGTAMGCPSAKLGLCSLAHKMHGGDGKCYALKAEYLYPQSIPFRTIQKIQFEEWDSEKIAHEIFTEAKRHLGPKSTKIRFVRFNESGDFHNIGQVIKAGEIAKLVAEYCLEAGIPLIRFYTYTHRSDIFLGNETLINSLPQNFTINGSNFKVHNNFQVMEISRTQRDTKEFGKFTCLDDCSKCSLCKTHGKGITIIQAKH